MDDTDPAVQGRAIEALSRVLGHAAWPLADQAVWAARGVLATVPALAADHGLAVDAEVGSGSPAPQRGPAIRGLLLPQGPCRGVLAGLQPALQVLAASLRVLELNGNSDLTGNLEVR
jgi:hypothetical protein